MDQVVEQVVEIDCFYREVPLHAKQLRRTRGRDVRGARYRIGGGRDADAPAPVEHLLIEPHGDAYLVHTRSGMSGEVQQGTERVPLHRWIEERGESFALPDDTHVWLKLGWMTFAISTAEAAAPVGPPPLVFRWSEQKYLVCTGLALALTLLLAWFLPPDAQALSMDRWGPDVRFLQARIIPPEPPPAPPGPAGAAGGTAGQAASGPEGAAGTPRARRRQARLARARPARTLAQQQADRRREIQQLAWLGRWRPDPGTAMGQLLQAGSALGEDAEEVLGAMMSAPVGESHGIGGLGTKGTGARGAGTGEDPLGTGALHTIGGCGASSGCDGGSGGIPHVIGRLQPRRAIGPQVIGGVTEVRGSLDKEIIRRVVRRHLPEVRFCYEQELPRAPTLAGRVAVNFTIAATGKVAAAVVQSSTLGNARAESCVVSAVRRWEFPQPQGGGIVIATYPFNFVLAGQ
jgi:TonB family protein